MAVNKKELAICKKRGHSVRALAGGWAQCQWCGIWLREVRTDVAILRLVASLRAGRPIIMCVDKYEHWVSAVGLLGERVIVIDPADAELALSYSVGDLAKRWEGESKPAYLGLML